jgi:hypothetical protein
VLTVSRHWQPKSHTPPFCAALTVKMGRFGMEVPQPLFGHTETITVFCVQLWQVKNSGVSNVVNRPPLTSPWPLLTG